MFCIFTHNVLNYFGNYYMFVYFISQKNWHRHAAMNSSIVNNQYDIERLGLYSYVKLLPTCFSLMFHLHNNDKLYSFAKQQLDTIYCNRNLWNKQIYRASRDVMPDSWMDRHLTGDVMTSIGGCGKSGKRKGSSWMYMSFKY